jgi:hypothetical protein
MGADIVLVSVPERLQEAIGETDGTNRLYRQYGYSGDFHWWLDAVMEICGQDGAYGPAVVARYCWATRAGVHKRLREGRMTAFLFHEVIGQSLLGRREALAEGGKPTVLIPGSEMKGWAEHLGRVGDMAALLEQEGEFDFRGRFLKGRGRKRK